MASIKTKANLIKNISDKVLQLLFNAEIIACAFQYIDLNNLTYCLCRNFSRLDRN